MKYLLEKNLSRNSFLILFFIRAFQNAWIAPPYKESTDCGLTVNFKVILYRCHIKCPTKTIFFFYFNKFLFCLEHVQYYFYEHKRYLCQFIYIAWFLIKPFHLFWNLFIWLFFIAIYFSMSIMSMILSLRQAKLGNDFRHLAL